MKRLRDMRGMTMVECIVSMAIVCVAALMLATCFSTAWALVRRGTDIANSNQVAFSAVENATDGESAAVTFTVGGTAFEVDGTYITSTSGTNPVITLVGFDVADAAGGE